MLLAPLLATGILAAVLQQRGLLTTVVLLPAATAVQEWHARSGGLGTVDGDRSARERGRTSPRDFTKVGSRPVDDMKHDAPDLE